MVDDDELDLLRTMKAPATRADARARALEAALGAYDLENSAAAPQGSAAPQRLTERARKLWSEIMNKKLMAAPAIAGLMALPIAGYVTYHLMQENAYRFGADNDVSETGGQGTALPGKVAVGDIEVNRDAETELFAPEPSSVPPANAGTAWQGTEALPRGIGDAASGADPALHVQKIGRSPTALGESKLSAPAQTSAPADNFVAGEENRERFEEFKTNPVRSALENPVSTFSIDVDTASYSFVRRSLKEGFLPQADAVRVEELVNYFPYDWKGPEDASVPFNTTVTVMPTPWNDHTKLMHIAIKGYDVQPATRPKANLVFLIDVSGSMNSADKLPLLQSAFRLLVNKLNAEDTVSIVTYAGDAGTVLMPTKVAERDKILSAIDNLRPGGTTAGEAGIREAYRLAEQSFVKDGVNRVMLATDGDFNVGQTDDDDLKRLIEEKRKSGVFLSVFGFGRGNLNDRMMQVIAQNGNGTAAYIDTLAEAEKVLVQDASSTLFTIAKDVKIQVEFNPAAISEYRLIGYETRALNREDFNNDRVDAGEIGSGHSVTAIYEVTPKGAPQMIDDLRYGQAATNNAAGIQNADEYAFVKIRYKTPDGDTSKLITTPVTASNEVSSFDAAGTDQRFSVAVAAFGQKLRDADAVAGMSWDRIIEIATAARGTDPFGYRSEFLSLARLASALDGGKR
ncbi:MAG TPA: VWA domain-containing protein [Rhizobiales bacterium]|nr:VWA domain-containing protein [Hyphomicrobiales bacterium]